MEGSAYSYWASGKGLGCITGANSDGWPEGEHFASFVRDFFRHDSVVEFGCGTGRLAELFEPHRYVGVDICQKALFLARKSHPAYDFELISSADPLPPSDATIAHTVMMHIPDEDLVGVVKRFNSPCVFISEILGRRWRRDGEPFVYNREQDDYEDVLAKAGYRRTMAFKFTYLRYGNTDLTFLGFAKC